MSELLKELFTSGAPAQVLEFFFLNPDERLYHTELGTRLAFAPLRLLIPRLVQSGLFTQGEEDKKIYYRANPESPIFAELRKLFLDYKRHIEAHGEGRENRWRYPDSSLPWLEEGSRVRNSAKKDLDPPPPVTGSGSMKDPADLEDSIRLLGAGKGMEAVRRLIARLAPLDVVAFVRGESGTGKDRVARAIHQASPRSRLQFFPVDCSTFSEAALDALLFGQDRRAAGGRGHGLLDWPGGGTVFLREIEELSLPLQRKLLRTMDEHQYIPTDGLPPVTVKVRLICGSTRGLFEKVAEGTFLYELHSKLALYEIWIPPLRERIEDILPIARDLIERWCHTMGCAVPVLERDAEQALMNRPWKGNVRELSDVLERTLHFLEKPSIGLSDLPQLPEKVHAPQPENLREARQLFEREHVARILEKYSQDKSQAAKALNVNLSTVYRLTRRLTMEA